MSPVALALAVAVASVAVPDAAPAGLQADLPRPSTALWTELTPEPDPPDSIPATRWFAPGPATLVEIDVDPGVPIAVWRVERDTSGRPLAQVEQRVEALGAGRYLLRIPPSPRALLAIVAGSGPVRAWELGSADGSTALRSIERRVWRWAAVPQEPFPALPEHPGLVDLRARLTASAGERGVGAKVLTARLRRSLLLGRLAWLDPASPGMSRARGPARAGSRAASGGAPVAVEIQGPSQLVLDARAAATEVPPPTPVPYDVVLRVAGGPALGRLPTGSRIADAGTPGAVSARRRLAFLVPPGDHRWEVLVHGTAVDLDARAYRARPAFPFLRDDERLRGLDRRDPEAAGRPEDRIHWRTSVVLPYPAGAETSVSGLLKRAASSSRSTRCGRDTSPGRSEGTRNLALSSGISAACPERGRGSSLAKEDKAHLPRSDSRGTLQRPIIRGNAGAGKPVPARKLVRMVLACWVAVSRKVTSASVRYVVE